MAFFEILLLKSIPVACCSPLISNALALLETHWTGADITKTQVHVHNDVVLLRITATEWRASILQDKASAAHGAKLQNQFTTLESKLTNPVKEVDGNLSLNTSGFSEALPQEPSNRSTTWGFTALLMAGPRRIKCEPQELK